MELRSLIEVFDRLQSYVFKAQIFDPSKKQGWREITQEEHDRAKELLKKYSRAKSETSSLIINIRNQVGAHRGNLNWLVKTLELPTDKILDGAHQTSL